MTATEEFRSKRSGISHQELRLIHGPRQEGRDFIESLIKCAPVDVGHVPHRPLFSPFFLARFPPSFLPPLHSLEMFPKLAYVYFLKICAISLTESLCGFAAPFSP